MDISRTAWDSFLKCKRCFYLERKLKIKAIGMPGHPINSRVDALLKVEFDIYREKQLPHPIFKKYNLKFKSFFIHYNVTHISKPNPSSRFIYLGTFDNYWYLRMSWSYYLK